MTGDLPPSSSVTGTKFSEAAFIICFATAPLPVYKRWSNFCCVKDAPTSGPPRIVANSSSSKAVSHNSFNKADVCSVYSLGLCII